jgi:hypothetical protein
MNGMIRRFFKGIYTGRGYKVDIIFWRTDTQDEGLILRKSQADIPVCPGDFSFHKFGRFEIGENGDFLPRRVNGLEKKKGKRLLQVNPDGIFPGIVVLNHQLTFHVGITGFKYLTLQADIHHMAQFFPGKPGANHGVLPLQIVCVYSPECTHPVRV